MYQRTGKPSVAKFRTRLKAIREASRSGRVLANHWNPKGANFQIQRDMIAFFGDAEKTSDAMLTVLEKRSSRG